MAVAAWTAVVFSCCVAAAQEHTPCSPGPCLVLTTGPNRTPSEESARHAKRLRGDAQISPLLGVQRGVPVPPDKNSLGMEALVEDTLKMTFQGADDQVRKVLETQFFPLVEEVAYWQQQVDRDHMEELCVQFLLVLPKPRWREVARACMAEFPGLKSRAEAQRLGKHIQPRFAEALLDVHERDLVVRTERGCSPTIFGKSTLGTTQLIARPLPGVYRAVVHCAHLNEPLVYTFDAHAVLERGNAVLDLSASARAQLIDDSHLHCPSQEQRAVARLTRQLIQESGAAGALVVADSPQGPVTWTILPKDQTEAAAPTPPFSTTPALAGRSGIQTRRKRVAAATGAASAVFVATAWAVTSWRSAVPVSDYIESGTKSAGTLSTEQYNELNGRVTRSRPVPWALSAAAVPLAGVALWAGRPALRRFPSWLHWTVGIAGLGLTTYASIELIRVDRCRQSDTRDCADDAYRRDRAGVIFSTAAPLLLEPLVVGPWRGQIDVGASSSSFSLSWRTTL